MRDGRVIIMTGSIEHQLQEKDAEIERLGKLYRGSLELLAEIKDAEREKLKALCVRAADALKDLDRFAFYCWSARNEKLDELIAELRRTAC